MTESTRETSAVRRRLMRGLAAAIAEKGLQTATVADIVRHAQTSKRSFYAHFADRDECYLALYHASCEPVIAAMELAGSAEGLSWQDRIRRTISAFLQVLEDHPEVTRAHYIDIATLGERGLAARRAVVTAYIGVIHRLTQHAEVAGPSHSTMLAVVGAVNELVLLEVESGRVDRLTRLADRATAAALALLVG